MKRRPTSLYSPAAMATLILTLEVSRPAPDRHIIIYITVKIQLPFHFMLLLLHEACPVINSFYYYFMYFARGINISLLCAVAMTTTMIDSRGDGDP